MAALATMAAAPQLAQAQPAPAGSYQRQCTDIRMNGPFLSAVCHGARGGGQSSINVQSCATDIWVDDTGALTCAGRGAPPPPPSGRYTPEPQPGYAPGAPYRDDRYSDRDRYREDRRYDRAAIVYGGRDFRGPSLRIDRAANNLNGSGLNDHVGSIELPRGSGPWIVCTDANFAGRCTMIERSVRDTRDIGMRDAISSLRPAR